jgi:hypothetical protein
MQEEPLSRVNYKDFIPIVEDTRSKKNESSINFAHRIDLKILECMGSGDQLKISAKQSRQQSLKDGPMEKDQIFTLGGEKNGHPEAALTSKVNYDEATDLNFE